MSFDPIPEPSMSSDYLKINPDEKHRIRIMGTSKDPATFIPVSYTHLTLPTNREV